MEPCQPTKPPSMSPRRWIVRIVSTIRRTYWSARVRRKAKSCGDKVFANFPTYVTANTVLGHNVGFNGMRIEGYGNVTIGDNFHSGRDCLMITSNHNYDSGSAIPYDETYFLKDVTIEDNVWLGSRVLILGGVTIGEGAIVQAGAVVVDDIPKCGIAGGNPAKTFKYRDIDHYNRLKEKKQFL